MENKHKEILEKAANTVEKAAVNVESKLAQQKTKLGTYGPALTVAVLVMLVTALAQNPMLLVYGLIVALIVLSPKILEKISKPKEKVVVKKIIVKKAAVKTKKTKSEE
jgi:Mg2+/citrate symporter